MSAITLLTSALQNDTGAGAAVDVSAYNTLRLNWTALADLGQDRNASLQIFIETAAAASGPWRAIYERQLDANGWEVAPRLVLSGFDSFVRARWAGRFGRTVNEGAYYSYTGPQGPSGSPQIAATKKFTIGLAGEAI